MEPYPHPYVLDTDGELQLVNPTINQVFGGLAAVLERIKSCSIRSINDIYDKKNLNVICDHAYDFKPSLTLKYIDEALKEIEEIKALGDKVVSNVMKEVSGAQEGEKWIVIDDHPEVTDEWLKTTTKLFIDDLIQKSETSLRRIRIKVAKLHALHTEENSPKALIAHEPHNETRIVQSSKAKAPTGNPHSFTYLHFSTKPENIKLLLDSLKAKKLVDDKTPLPNFRQVFSGKQIKTPVKWTGGISTLAYFIKKIADIPTKVHDLKGGHWEIALKCFVDKDGNPFDREKLRWQQKPARERASNIEKLVNQL